MRKLVILGVVVFVAGLVADIALKALAESQIETTAQREAPDATTDAAIPVFPFLPPLLLAGKVDEVSVHMRQVSAGAAVFDRLDFDLHGVTISRRALFDERRVELVDIDRGTVSAVVALPAPVRNLPIDGLTARVAGRSIVLRGPGGASASIPLPRASLLPCEEGAATLLAGRVRVTCTLDDIPPALVEAINKAS